MWVSVKSRKINYLILVFLDYLDYYSNIKDNKEIFL